MFRNITFGSMAIRSVTSLATSVWFCLAMLCFVTLQPKQASKQTKLFSRVVFGSQQLLFLQEQLELKRKDCCGAGEMQKLETHNVLLYGWHQKDNEKHFSFPFWDFPIHVPTFKLEKNQCPSNFKGKNSCNLDDNQSNLSDVSLVSYIFLWVEN